MSITQDDSVARAEASVLTTARGVPWWAAVLIAVVPTVAGLVIDLAGAGAIGWTARILTVLGAVLAVLAVRRDSLFTPMVMPPLVVALSLVVSYLVTTNSGVLNLGLKLVNTFPLMLTATATALVLGMIRIIAQPLRTRVSSSASHV